MTVLQQVKRKAEEEKLAEVMAGEINFVSLSLYQLNVLCCYQYLCLPLIFLYIKSTVLCGSDMGEIKLIMLCIVKELPQTFK